MSKKATVLGVSIDNYTFKGAITRAGKYLDDMVVNVIQMVSLKTINEAADDEMLKDYLEKVDLSVVSDVQVLQMIGEPTKGRLREVGDGFFVKAYLRRIKDAKKTVCLLVPSEEVGNRFNKFLSDEDINLNIVSTVVADTGSENFNWETVANEINSNSVGVVVSMLDIARNRDFLQDYKNFLSVEAFWAVGSEPETFAHKQRGFAGLKRRILRRLAYRKA